MKAQVHCMSQAGAVQLERDVASGVCAGGWAAVCRRAGFAGGWAALQGFNVNCLSFLPGGNKKINRGGCTYQYCAAGGGGLDGQGHSYPVMIPVPYINVTKHTTIASRSSFSGSNYCHISLLLLCKYPSVNTAPRLVPDVFPLLVS